MYMYYNIQHTLYMHVVQCTLYIIHVTLDTFNHDMFIYKEKYHEFNLPNVTLITLVVYTTHNE